MGRIFIRLKPRTERPGADDIMQELRPKLSAIPGIKVYLQNLPTIRIGGKLTKSQYQFTLQDADTNELFHWAPLLEDKLRTLPGFEDVTTDLQISNPKVTVEIDRNKASALGVTAEQIENVLYRRLWLAPGIDHLHPQQRVLGDHGAGSEIPDGPVCTVVALRSLINR